MPFLKTAEPDLNCGLGKNRGGKRERRRKG